MTQPEICVVCGSHIERPLLHLPGPLATTSLGHVIEADTTVFQCERCSHVQTKPLPRVEDYYDTSYNIRSESEEEDDLYEFRDGKPTYRSGHQAEVFLKAHAGLKRGARILDFGCAKAASLRMILQQRTDLDPYVYDVSPNYTKFWNEFVPPENQAVHQLKPEWNDYFDVILSFFALEHTQDPQVFVKDLAKLLAPGGKVHIVFPNMYANAADMIVVDHVNHFSEPSIRRLFAECGLEVESIDTGLHNAAHVVTARRAAQISDPKASDPEITASLKEGREIADFWSHAREKLVAFESANPTNNAIYGSGVYGLFIATNLRNAGHIAYFLDQNPHQQTKKLLGKGIIAPASVGADIDAVYVGLNPKSARKIIESVPALHARERHYFFF